MRYVNVEKDETNKEAKKRTLFQDFKTYNESETFDEFKLNMVLAGRRVRPFLSQFWWYYYLMNNKLRMKFAQIGGAIFVGLTFFPLFRSLSNACTRAGCDGVIRHYIAEFVAISVISGISYFVMNCIKNKFMDKFETRSRYAYDEYYDIFKI